MTLFKNKYRIETIRLKNYDYSKSGAYFITIVTHNRQCIFGKISDGRMILNDGGKIAQQCWMDIPEHFPHAELDEFVIMPNHIHGIIILNEINNQTFVETNNYSSLQMQQIKSPSQSSQQKSIFRSPSKTIGSIVRGFKIGVTKWFRKQTDIYTVWQQNYYEHIIRNDDELNRIRQYIIINPSKWTLDKNYV